MLLVLIWLTCWTCGDPGVWYTCSERNIFSMLWSHLCAFGVMCLKENNPAYFYQNGFYIKVNSNTSKAHHTDLNRAFIDLRIPALCENLLPFSSSHKCSIIYNWSVSWNMNITAFMQSLMLFHVFTESTNSSDNIYTMMNPGPPTGNRSNVST